LIKSSKKHLEDTNENYFLHMLIAMKIAVSLLIAGVKAFIHAFIPGLFTKSASKKISELHLFIQKRKKT